MTGREEAAARPPARPAPAARPWIRWQHLRWMRGVAAYGGGLIVHGIAIVGVVGGAFILCAVVFSPDEHEAARNRVVGAWRVWSSLFASDEAVHQWAAGTRFEHRDVAGVRFISGLTDRPGFKERWCYVRKAGRAGAADLIIELGTAMAVGDAALVPRWTEPSAEQAQHFDRSASQLAAAARSGCLLT